MTINRFFLGLSPKGTARNKLQQFLEKCDLSKIVDHVNTYKVCDNAQSRVLGINDLHITVWNKDMDIKACKLPEITIPDLRKYLKKESLFHSAALQECADAIENMQKAMFKNICKKMPSFKIADYTRDKDVYCNRFLCLKLKLEGDWINDSFSESNVPHISLIKYEVNKENQNLCLYYLLDRIQMNCGEELNALYESLVVDDFSLYTQLSNEIEFIHMNKECRDYLHSEL